MVYEILHKNFMFLAWLFSQFTQTNKLNNHQSIVYSIFMFMFAYIFEIFIAYVHSDWLKIVLYYFLVL